MTISLPLLRNATVTDATSMDVLNRQCLPENYPLVEWKTILTMVPDVSTVIYDNDGKLIGYCLGIIYPFAYAGVVASLVVHPDFRGKGIANNLITTCVQNMKA